MVRPERCDSRFQEFDPTGRSGRTPGHPHAPLLTPAKKGICGGRQWTTAGTQGSAHTTPSEPICIELQCFKA